MIPRKGAEVAEITIKDLEDVLQVRAALGRNWQFGMRVRKLQRNS